MKNNKSPGENEIVIEFIKNVGDALLQALKILFNECILQEITPTQWNHAIIILMLEKGDNKS